MPGKQSARRLGKLVHRSGPGMQVNPAVRAQAAHEIVKLTQSQGREVLLEVAIKLGKRAVIELALLLARAEVRQKVLFEKQTQAFFGQDARFRLDFALLVCGQDTHQPLTFRLFGGLFAGGTGGEESGLASHQRQPRGGRRRARQGVEQQRLRIVGQHTLRGVDHRLVKQLPGSLPLRESVPAGASFVQDQERIVPLRANSI
jgi:hypothetical protein